MWIAGIAVLVSVFTTIAAGRFIDKYNGHKKVTLVFLLLVAALAFLWFLLLSEGLLPVTKCEYTFKITKLFTLLIS